MSLFQSVELNNINNQYTKVSLTGHDFTESKFTATVNNNTGHKIQLKSLKVACQAQENGSNFNANLFLNGVVVSTGKFTNNWGSPSDMFENPNLTLEDLSSKFDFENIDIQIDIGGKLVFNVVPFNLNLKTASDNVVIFNDITLYKNLEYCLETSASGVYSPITESITDIKSVITSSTSSIIDSVTQLGLNIANASSTGESTTNNLESKMDTLINYVWYILVIVITVMIISISVISSYYFYNVNQTKVQSYT